jgi:xanthine dehydrogenase accessory factor
VKREALRALVDGQPRLVQIVGGADSVEQSSRPGELRMATTCPSGGSLDIFIEPRLPRPLLLVFGGSPAARVLVRMAALTGFRVCAIDPGGRPEDFPGADDFLSGLDLSEAGIGADAAAVVVTMGHYDEDALEAALAHPTLDVALVASARRAASVRDILRDRGLHEATLARIRTPAGRVRAGSQPEIALFALADLVAARHERMAAAGGGSAPAPGPGGVADAAPAFATDPVCGMTVELPSRHSTVHAGEAFHFCCERCRRDFEADPTRYLAAARG